MEGQQVKADGTCDDGEKAIIPIVSVDEHSDASEEEEEECRVCRGPAEDERPLFAPCKCSGSIGLTHQDCLTSWLAVTRGDGRCELCSTKFRFAPKYADGAPEQLPPHEVVLGLCSRASAKWLPFALRVVLVASIWLIIAPLSTAYLYHAWIHRPSSILKRFKWELIPGDIVSGAVIASIIIVSFLSFMSFADFLRFFDWNQDEGRGRRGEMRGQDQRDEENVDDDQEEPDDVDEVILDHDTFFRREQNFLQPMGVMDQRQPLFAENLDRDNARRRVRWDDEELEEEIREQIRPVLAGVLHDIPDVQRQELQRRIRQAVAFRRQVQAMEAEDEEARLNRGANVNALDAANHVRIEPQNGVNEHDLAVLDLRDPHAVVEAEAEVDDMVELLREQDLEMWPPNDDAEDQHRDHEPLLNNRFEPQFEPLDPVMNQDGDAEMEVNVPLDELLGLRGPANVLVRNLMWLLAFNATYLGIFAFIPKSLGVLVISLTFNMTRVPEWTMNIPYFGSVNSDDSGVHGMIALMNAESKRLETTLQLPDLTVIAIGYFSIGGFVLLLDAGIRAHHKFAATPNETILNVEGNHGFRRPRPDDDLLGGFPINFGQGDDNDDDNGEAEVDAGVARRGPDNRRVEHLGGNLADQLSFALDCLKALTKVGFLLFLKMLFLPLVLGIWLDAATLSLFGSKGIDRILYAGGDLFASSLLHWVAGITFMLLVTVSVLQLREVAHPELLARVIRPQEPQPDLLGNLLHESAATHGKRMMLSFAIYAALLVVYVWLPARIVTATGITHYLPFSKLMFWHLLLPQLQVPLELLAFHLTMLALLEKHKNHIGEMQHHWLVFICDKLGLTDFVIPRSVDKFFLVGSRHIFKKHVNSETKHCEQVDDATSGSLIKDESRSADREAGFARHIPLRHLPEGNQVDPFWYELATKDRDIESFVLANIVRVPASEHITFDTGKTRRNGERTLRTSQFIRLPAPSPELHLGDRRRRRRDQGADLPPSSIVESNNLLPTTIGPFRLRRRVLSDGTMIIEFWREVAGDPIPRPPEGWDDLGVGGAELQGRWAWGTERRSTIERGVARRAEVFSDGMPWMSLFPLIIKGTVLIISSWVAISVVVCATLNGPLAVGRLVFFLLQVPKNSVHDPLAFAIGLGVLVPSMSVFVRLSKLELSALPTMWALRWRLGLPPIRKLVVLSFACFLWIIVSPVTLGIIYDLAVIKASNWFAHEGLANTVPSSMMSWGTGTLILNAWAVLSYFNAFTGGFWRNVGNGLFEPEPDRANHGVGRGPQHHAPGGDEEPVEGVDRLSWQGQNGRIGRFVDVLVSLVSRWEWDRVDHVILLDECALPVTKQILITILGPSVAYTTWCYAMHVLGHSNLVVILPLIGLIDKGRYRMIVFRAFTGITISLQLGAANQIALQKWFQAAHKAARDGRYLEGETLMNYLPKAGT